MLMYYSNYIDTPNRAQQMTFTAFTNISINGREYRILDVTANADGSQELRLSRAGSGSVYTVTVSAQGEFSAPRFAY